MAAAQRFDPFNKGFGGNSNSDLLNAILSLAQLVAQLVAQGEGISMNKCREFSIFNSKAGAHRNVGRPHPNYVHADNDHAESGRKTKGSNAGSANHNMNKKNSRKSKRSRRRSSDVISEDERERRRRQSEADKENFARLQQLLLEEKEKLKILKAEKKKKKKKKKKKSDEPEKVEKILRVEASEFELVSLAESLPPQPASRGAPSAAPTQHLVPAALSSSPPTTPIEPAVKVMPQTLSYSHVVATGAAQPLPSASKELPSGMLGQPLVKALSSSLTVPPPMLPPFFGRRGLAYLNYGLIAYRPRPEYPGVKLSKTIPAGARFPYDLRTKVPYTLPDGRQHVIYFYRQRLDTPGPLDGVWVHDYSVDMPGKRTIKVLREAVEKRR
jgi:hypothetical protein